MAITIKKLEQAAKIMEQIKALDDEIIQIDKIAMGAANDNISIVLTMSITNLLEVKESIPDSIIDPYKAMMDRMSVGLFYTPSYFSKPVEENKADVFANTISNNAALGVLGVLLFEKRTQRDELIKKLQNIGVSI